MDEDQAPNDRVHFRPTIAPGFARGAEQFEIRFEGTEGARQREAEFREFFRPGQTVPLIWNEGVASLEVVAVHPDGSIEVRGAKS